MPRTTPAAMIVAAALAATLTACADGSAEDTSTAAAPAPAEETATQEPVAEDTTADTAEDTEAAPSEEASEAATGDDAAAAGGALQELPYDQGLVDDVMGHEVRFTGLVRDFPAPAIMEDFEGEILLVEVEATAGDTYSTAVRGPFRLTAAEDGGFDPGSSTTIADEDMAAAGYPPYVPAEPGETSTGWIAFQANTRADSYMLEYTRLGATVIGSDDTIEEQVWEFPLP